jgi:hypothetical protein
MGRGVGGVLAAVVALGVGCAQRVYSDGTGDAGSGASSGSGCIPGTQQTCACGGGAVGIQDCDAQGAAFGACQCGTGGSSASSTAGSTTSSSSTSSSSTSSGAGGGAGGACAGHVHYAGLYPAAPSVWSNLPSAGGLTGLDAGNLQCQALGLGADHVCDLTEVQAANDAQEALFMAIPAGTTAWMQRTDPGLPESPGDPGFHYDNDTIFDPTMANEDNHHTVDFSCAVESRAILCCYPPCM